MRSKVILIWLSATWGGWAQAPTGTIAGAVQDPSGARIPGAKVGILSVATGLTRKLAANEQGEYSAPALAAGSYEVTAEAQGFQRLDRPALVEAGSTTTVDLVMLVGEASQTVTVEGAAPQIRYDSHQLGGVVTRGSIENLPLNGRSFLELVKLEPGATNPTKTTGNRTLVPVLSSPWGQSGAATRVTVDGGSVMAIGTGGTPFGMSQEAVQEFQASSVNFDLSTGVTASGSINIVTRSGGNDFHGGGYFFLRDHNFAAYPALNRDPANPDPFFQRRQSGLLLGGPIRHDRAFFFVNVEKNRQRGVISVQPQVPEFAKFGQIAPSPLDGTQVSARFDFRLSPSQTAFARYTHDGSGIFGPTGFSTLSFQFPSSWARQRFWADQSLGVLTSVLAPNLVNDLRFSYFFFSGQDAPPTAAECPGACLGLGAPQITIQDIGILIGSSQRDSTVSRRYGLLESLSWQKGSHRFRFGFEAERSRIGGFTLTNEPAALALYSPLQARQQQLPVPASFDTLDDILRLPLSSFVFGVGDGRTPNRDFSKIRSWPLWRLYFQDTWRVRPRLTFNYGLAWEYEPGVFNTDLTKPQYLAPILGNAGLRPTRDDPNNFSPAAGFAWAATGDGKIVVRGGAGLYYDRNSATLADTERGLLAPRGVGRAPNLSGSGVPNPLSGISGVPLGTALNFPSGPTAFTAADLLAILPAIRVDELRRRGDPNNRDFSIRNIEVDKQAGGATSAASGALWVQDATTPYSLHYSLGAQREIAHNLVLSADFVHRQFVHLSFAATPQDYNHFNSARGPVIPKCVGAERDDPAAQCSTGSILVNNTGLRGKYTGLLLRLDKRFSARIQLLASYALSRSLGHNVFGVSQIFNNDDWSQNYGPLDRDRRHVLNVSGVVDLPKRLQASFSSAYYSKTPFNVYVGAIDFNGSGTVNDVLPGTRVNEFNRGLGKDDLARLVDQFNRTLAGTKTSRGQLIPTLGLPPGYEFGGNYISQDLRLSRAFVFRERYRLQLLGEVFNLLNIANLSGYMGNLRQASSFGQPGSRETQVFGSGGRVPFSSRRASVSRDFFGLR
jgi:hypothetical protein